MRHVYGSLQKALQAAYPTIEWKFNKFTSRGQQYLKELVGKVFGEYEILENFKHPSLVFPISQKKVELDLYVPALELAFEYQGKQHEHQIHRGDLRRQTERDKEKKELCKNRGITLICIPYRWSGLLEDLRATILHHRPDIRPLIISKDTATGKLIFPVLAGKTPLENKHNGSIQFMLPKLYRPILDPTDW